MDADTDLRAASAARAVLDGAAVDVDAAIAQLGDGPRPSTARVRRHLEAMRQADFGLGAWWRERLAALEAVVELVRTIQFVAPGATVLLTGRTAQGHVDDLGPATARVLGVDAPALLDALEAHGLQPPEVSSLTTVLGAMPVAHVQTSATGQLNLLILPDVPEARAKHRLTDETPVSVLDVERFCAIVDAARESTPEA